MSRINNYRYNLDYDCLCREGCADCTEEARALDAWPLRAADYAERNQEC